MTRRKDVFLLLSGLMLILGGRTWAAPPVDGDKTVLLAIEKALQKHGPEVHRCFEKALAERLDVSGKIEIEVQLGKAGKVVSAKAKKSEKALPVSLGACVEKAALGFVLEGLEPGATVILPFSFKPQTNQFVVKAADIPDRQQTAAGAEKPGPKRAPPFTAKVLADETNVKARSLSLTLLSVGPASRVAMHRHPTSGKVLYLLKGHARLLGPDGVSPQKVEEGTAVYVPPAFPHVIENMGRQTTAVFLQAFIPPGPERVYRDPKDPKGRAGFEVIRDPAQAIVPAGSSLFVVDAASAALVPGPTAQSSQRNLLPGKATIPVELSQVELNDGAEFAGKGTSKWDEFYFSQVGGGTLRIAGETMTVEPESVLCIPAGTPFAFRAAALEKGQKVVLLKLVGTSNQ